MDAHCLQAAEFKINLLRPARGELLLCRAKVRERGRLLTVVEAEVSCRAGQGQTLVSKALATIAVVPDPSRQPAETA